MSLTIASILAESAVRHADRTAVVLGPMRITYSQLWHAARQYATVLKERGIEPGDRVALLLPNTPHFPLAYFGTLALKTRTAHDRLVRRCFSDYDREIAIVAEYGIGPAREIVGIARLTPRFRHGLV